MPMEKLTWVSTYFDQFINIFAFKNPEQALYNALFTNEVFKLWIVHCICQGVTCCNFQIILYSGISFF